ncbi:MAG: pyroglutamyl-peptidase I [Caldisphaera sp.]|jgi:pyroglutamyl-peptidase|nr:pyroglutamyl-peptidase I [Caldisphaera sp.]PMP91643.1 MAG: pyroglutamyl-peptidase I [Caldisphaera sp.]
MKEISVLLTGFEPFGGESVNPSEIVSRDVTKQIDNTLFKDFKIKAKYAVIPVSFKRSSEALIKVLKETKPLIAISLGQWGGIPYITVERVAVNLKDSIATDNDGVTATDEPIEPSGPAAYFTTLPLKVILTNLRNNGIPASISNSAGTYMCNLVFYELMHFSAKEKYPIKAGFMHVPYLPEQVAMKKGEALPPSMDKRLMIEAIKIAIETTIDSLNI